METAIGTGVATDDRSGAAGERAATAALGDLPGERVDFCQVFASADYEHGAVLDGVRGVIGEDAVVVGCSATGPFTDERTVERGVAVALVAGDGLRFFAGVGTGLSGNVSGAVREAVSGFPETPEGYPHRAAVVLHDGLCDVGEELALATQRKLGPGVGIAGGSASDDLRFESTPVFYDDRVLDDAVVVVLIAAEDCPGVAFDHGHEPVTEPVEVTRTDGVLVHELDGRPAFEVWKDAVREPVRERYGVAVEDLAPDGERMETLTAEFQFGIDQGDEYKIRWADHIPAEDGQAIKLAVEVPEGTVMRVMQGGAESQVASAGRAAAAARERSEDTAYAGGFVYDCACRSSVLGDRFPEAVEGIADRIGAPFVGFETIGELCMRPGEFSGFHNATTAVLLLPK